MSFPSSVDGAIVLRVLRALAQQPGMTRAELAEHAAASRPSVSAALRLLEDRGLLEQRASDVERPAIGRPPMHVFLAGTAASSVGLEVTRTELRAAIFDAAGGLLAEAASPIGGFEDVDGLLDDAERLVGDLVEQGSGPVLGIGVAVAAPIDRAGRVVDGVSLTRWAQVDLRRELSERLGLPVTVENDANAAALAEHRFGAGRDCAELLYLHLSPGVGAGLILGNRLYRGAAGIAGELGHVTVDPDGALCSCGSRGCLETIAGPRALEGELRSARGFEPLGEWIALAGTGDRQVRRLVADAGTAIGTAVATAVNLLNPGRVVVGGRLADAGPVLLDAIDAALVRDAIEPAAARARVVAGELGSRAAILGVAAAVVSQELVALVAPETVSATVA
ncbi:MAG TPA: ROK family transcriptional regulator [Solirubrobacter sp.]|nr:ROK family transcriptional regulator [Solirubrobacter sp.]